MSKLWGQVAQLVGAAGVTVGSWQLLPAAGWIVGGVLLVVIGVGLERGNAE
jgi:hypothetical protein